MSRDKHCAGNTQHSPRPDDARQNAERQTHARNCSWPVNFEQKELREHSDVEKNEGGEGDDGHCLAVAQAGFLLAVGRAENEDVVSAQDVTIIQWENRIYNNTVGEE